MVSATLNWIRKTKIQIGILHLTNPLYEVPRKLVELYIIILIVQLFLGASEGGFVRHSINIGVLALRYIVMGIEALRVVVFTKT